MKNENSLFTIVGMRPAPLPPKQKKAPARDFPWLSAAVLTAIILLCVLAPLLTANDPGYFYLEHCNEPPSRMFPFGTDNLGRDVFAGIWYGGRVSLTVGFLSTLIATAIAVLYGSLSGVAPAWLDGLMMHFVEIFLSVPSLLLVLFLQAFFGSDSVLSLCLVIGVTGWADMAKVIRTEVRQLRSSEYVTAAKCMGGRFFHVLWQHLAPNFVASVMFMVVMSVRSAIGSESTLSFLGMGLPLETVSWGTMLSLAEKALMTGAWWCILIPGLFLVALLLCLTNLGNYLRRASLHKTSCL